MWNYSNKNIYMIVIFINSYLYIKLDHFRVSLHNFINFNF